MADGDVPPDEMFSIRRGSDDLDAARRGEPIDDRVLADLVGTIRAAYVPEAPRRRSASLAAFAGPGDRPLEPLVPTAPPVRTPVRRPVAAGLVAVLATLTGKIVLGGAVAAAAIGGLHAAEVVDVPLLPDVGRHAPAPPAEPAPATDGAGVDGDGPAGAEETPPVGTDPRSSTTVPANRATPGEGDAPDTAPDRDPGTRRPDEPGPSTDAPPNTTTRPTAGSPTTAAPAEQAPRTTGSPSTGAPEAGGSPAGGLSRESPDTAGPSPDGDAAAAPENQKSAAAP